MTASQPPPVRRLLSPWLLLGAGLILTTLATIEVARSVRDEAVRQFTFATEQVALKIQERLYGFEYLLHGAAAMVTGSGSVTRSHWRAYVDALLHAARARGRAAPIVQGIGLAEWIPPDRLAAHEARVRAEGFPDYRVTPVGKRAAYTAIVYLEPFRDRNLRAFGYDMYSEPVRRAAMEEARDTSRATLSGKVQLVQETDVDVQAGVLMYVPIYRPNAPLATVEQRRAALIGWSYSPYRMRDLMHGMLEEWNERLNRDMNLTVHDGLERTPSNVLFASNPGVAQPDPQFTRLRVLAVNGRQWTLHFEQAPGQAQVNHLPAFGTAVLGLIASLLLFWLRLALVDTRRAAHRIADQLTADIRAHEHLLAESEFRWKFALEGSGLGLWDWDIKAGKVHFSTRWKEMLGYDDAEIGDSLDEWNQRVHPDDRTATMAAIGDYLAGRTPVYDNEHRMRCKDGSWMWIRDRGTVILRAPDGDPLRMLGTHSDITARKVAELRARAVAQLYAALSATNAAIIRCTSAAELFARTCELVVRYGGMNMAWIGTIEPGDARVRVAEKAGRGTDYLDGIQITTAGDDPNGQGATGTALRDNCSVWIDNFRDDPRTWPWRERAARYGWVSSAALPIRRAGVPIAALTFYSTEAGWFTPETRALLEEITAAISFALDKYEQEAETHAARLLVEQSERHFRGMIEQSIVGMCVVQEARIAYGNPRFCAIVGYAPAELSGCDPTRLFGAESRARIDAARAALVAGAPSVQLVLPFTTRDGQNVELGMHVSPGVWDGRDATLVIAQDITERRRAEEKIAAYVRQLEGAMRGTLGAVARMVDLRDPYTAGHERRVGLVAAAIARELGWSAERCDQIELIGLVHDIGKIAVPAEVLSKPSRLSDLEYEMIKTHAERGYEILKDVDFPIPIAEIIRQHHERLDGSGYPRGLTGDAILPEARVLAVADVIESMASHRPYRPALGIDAALAEIERHRGSRYDPQVVDAVVRMVREQGYVLPT